MEQSLSFILHTCQSLHILMNDWISLHVKYFRAHIRKLPTLRMSEPDQDEMRRKRLARLSAPGGGEKSKQVQSFQDY